MSDHRDISADRGRVNVGGVIFIVLEIAGIAAILWWPAPPLIAKVFTISIIAIFVVFLLGVARGSGGRNVLLVISFIALNIASIIVAFGYLYHSIGLVDSLRKDRLFPTIWDGIYFSVITLTTVGYGDITPTLESRSIAAFEALTGYVVMGLLISILVIIAQRDR